MFFWRKRDWRSVIKGCNHDLAGSALMHYLTTHRPSPQLAAALESYFHNPCYDSALEVISAEPETIMVFRECRPGGVYHRLTATR